MVEPSDRNHRGDGLTPQEMEWLENVADRVDPPESLRREIVGRLRATGLLDAGPAMRARRGPALSRIAAGFLLAFLAGGIVGRMSVRVTAAQPTGTPALTAGDSIAAERYLLLLYEGADFQPVGRTIDELVGEYAAWANQLERRGRLVAAEKLAGDGSVVPVSAAGPGAETPSEPVPVSSGMFLDRNGVLTGFFVVHAGDYEEAARIARESPHATYGGRIVIRRIDPT